MTDGTAGVSLGPTFADLVQARATDDAVGLRFEDRSWTWREVVAQARRRGALAGALRDAGPWHVGVLLENTPEHLFWLLGATSAGATVVGINPTRRGAELAQDLRATDCRVVITDRAGRGLLAGLAHGVDEDLLLDVDSTDYRARLAAAPPVDAAVRVPADTIFSLVFTSGTTSAPKAVICTQRRMGRIAEQQRDRRSLTAADVFYVAMPMFHSNAVMAGIAPAVCTGGTIVLRRRFSASQFLPDVRRYGVTFFNYVGKPLRYVLSTPELPDDADNPLRIAFGNEAAERDIAEFARRFGTTVIDSFGSTEGEIHIMRTPHTPPGALGVAAEGTVVLDPDTLVECPPACFDAAGRLTNPQQAIGEIVNKVGADLFEGYYRNPAAGLFRLRHGWVWSGDLGYRDEGGYFYFAGRSGDWLRVDGENLAVAPIERLLQRHPAVEGVAVVAVPDPVAGDEILAVLEVPDRELRADDFVRFLTAQPDLGTKWLPRYVRIVDHLPRTATDKLRRRAVRAALPDGPAGLWVRDGSELAYRPADAYDAARVRSVR